MNRERPIIVTDRDFELLRLLHQHAHLVSELERADVVDSGQVPPDVVTMNSRVVYEDVMSGKTTEVTIVLIDNDHSVERMHATGPAA